MLSASLAEAKSNLLTTKPELKELATSSQSYDDMLQIMSHIEQLQAVPEKLDARISEKHFLSAVDLLQDALRMIRKSELEPVGALSDLRAYFSNQEASLTDILVEELHDHLYLKSPYCLDRWKTPSQDADNQRMDSMHASRSTAWERPIYRFLSDLDTSTPMKEDPSRNPEADNFYYIRLIIEALNKMGNLDLAVDRIEQRLPIELFAVVDKTNAEVDNRHPATSRGMAKEEQKKMSIPTVSEDVRGGVLSDFLWTLYSKFQAIAEGHRVVHEVVGGIVEREGLRNAKAVTSGFKELWKLYQSEMRSLLHDYLATDGDSSFRTRQNPSDTGNAFRQRQRDKTKRMFKMAEMDPKANETSTESDNLDDILKASVPGLVSKSKRLSGALADNERQGNQSAAAGHKLLIEPSVFNMSLLLPPSLSFLQRLKEIVPQNSDIVMSTLTSFLDDFLINVFHPQLDEAVSELCAQSFIEADAFQQAPHWSQHARRPVFKGTVTFHDLVKAFSKMLDDIPHDQLFTQLILAQMNIYFEKCSGWYKAMVTRAQARTQTGQRLKTAAMWAESGELQGICEKIREGPESEKPSLLEKAILSCPSEAEVYADRLEQENLYLIAQTNETPLEPFDIISDPKNVTALSLLYNSMVSPLILVPNLSSSTDSATAMACHPPHRPPSHHSP